MNRFLLSSPTLAYLASRRQVPTYQMLLVWAMICGAGWGMVSPAWGQNFSACKGDYSLLQQEQLSSFPELEMGKKVYLRPAYLQAIEDRVFDRLQSGTIHYSYLRPATRKELKEGEIKESTRERVGKDGNIYVAKESASSSHLFRTNSSFEGDFYGKWNDPFLVLPLGLEPISPSEIVDQGMKLVEKNKQYLVFELRGHQLVFYVGYPEIEFIFQDEANRQELSDKEVLAQALIGKSFLVERSPNLRFRSSPEGQDVAPAGNVGRFDIQVKDVVVSAEQVLLVSNHPYAPLLVIDGKTDFAMYDQECIQQMRRESLQRMLSGNQAEKMNRQLNQLASKLTRGTTSAEDWEKLDLADRFFLQPHSGPTPTYEYLLHPTSSSSQLEPFLTARVNADGKCWLESHFASQNGLYHTRVYVYFSESDSLVSSRVPSLSEDHQRRYEGDWIVEEIQFRAERDQELLQRIATEPNADIWVRFSAGGSFYEDHLLPKVYQQAIRDSWLMSQWLRQQSPSLSQD